MPVQFARREFLAGMVAMTAGEGCVAAFSSFPRQPGRWQFCRSAFPSSTTRFPRISATPAKWRRANSAWDGLNCAACGTRTSSSLDEKEVAEARRILEKYQLKVTDIASPLFKVDWPGAPKSKFSEAKSFGADFTLAQQDEVLERAMDLAKAFQTDRVRCFDFWRLEDQAPYRAAINDKLRDAAAKAEKKGIIAGARK